ncbi:MAG: hypothetical protein MJE68_19940, partial [Proteobacteria bacterium]|nr:hypothetical protein [Pseudomonadota bacterium]
KSYKCADNCLFWISQGNAAGSKLAHGKAEKNNNLAAMIMKFKPEVYNCCHQDRIKCYDIVKEESVYCFHCRADAQWWNNNVKKI